MKTNYTKGEWKVSKEPFSLLVTHQSNNSVESICQISQRYKSEGEQHANAKLIAAAPDLLEALSKLYNAIDSCVELTPEILIRSQLAIKKATE